MGSTADGTRSPKSLEEESRTDELLSKIAEAEANAKAKQQKA